MVIEFSKKFSKLVNSQIPKQMLTSQEDRGGYLSRDNSPKLPKENKKDIIRTPNGFLINYCEEY